MPPKKRARYAAPAPAATSMAEVSKVQLKLRDWLQDVHALRHCTAGNGQDADPTEVKGWPQVETRDLSEYCPRCLVQPTTIVETKFGDAAEGRRHGSVKHVGRFEYDLHQTSCAALIVFP